MGPIRKIPKKFTKKFGNKVTNRQYFCRKTGLKNAHLHISFHHIVIGRGRQAKRAAEEVA